MKKITAALLCAILVISASITVFGATKTDVADKVNSSAAYIHSNYAEKGYGAYDSANLYVAAKSGIDVSNYTDSYFKAVLEKVESGEFANAGSYGLIICIADATGVDAENIGGKNFVELLKNADAKKGVSAYYYYYAIKAALDHSLNDKATELCEALKSYYTIGKGTDFWNGYGTSADDLGIFISALALDYDNYSEYVDDAVKILETFYTEDGYVNYKANANSTGLALAAYASVNNTEKANEAYNLLVSKFYDEKTGSFIADYDNMSSTKDALFGLLLYLPITQDDTVNTPDKDETSTEDNKNDTNKNPNSSNTQSTQNNGTAQNTDKKADETKSPATGAEITGAAVAAFISAGAVLLLSTKRKSK